MADGLERVPPSLRKYRVSRSLLQATADAFRNYGKGRREIVALWQGRVLDESTAEITALRVPAQDTGARHFSVPLNERLRIAQELAQAKEVALIQVHTHPAEAFHSAADDQYALTKHTGAISIVIPRFGLDWNGQLTQAAVFRNRGAGRWEELSTVEVEHLFEVMV